MVKAILKRKELIANILFISLLSVLPFGQIFKIGNILFLDVIVSIIGLFTLITVKKYPKWYKYFINFIVFGLFSWLFNYLIFRNSLVLKGFFYLFRLFVYSLLPIFILIYVKNKGDVYKKLIGVAVVITILGWLQYFIFPNTTSLKILNWDDHYHRMIGTFLDPGYLAVLLILGSILSLQKKKYLIFGILIISLLFTYSRAGYLAASLSFLYYFWRTKNLNAFALVISICFLFFLLFLPKGQNQGEGLNLNRVSTIRGRISNYNQGFSLFKKSPAIGFGYNNLCLAKLKYLDKVDVSSHSCFGLDNSSLFVLVSTGVVGLILFIYLILNLPTNILIVTSFLAILISSLFSNAMFYPHIMAWIGILLGLGVKVNRKRR